MPIKAVGLKYNRTVYDLLASMTTPNMPARECNGLMRPALTLLLLAVTAFALPLNSDKAKTRVTIEDDTTLSTDLKPPPLEDTTTHRAVAYVINLYAVRNDGNDSSNAIVKNDIVEKSPELLEPIATVLLVLDADDGKEPVSLDGLAEDLKSKGFKVEKIDHDGETRIIKVNLENEEVEDVIATTTKPKADKQGIIRRKRSPFLKGKLFGGKGGGGGYGGGGYGGGGYGGGGYGGGSVCCSGGGYPTGGGSVKTIPVVVVPVTVQRPVYQVAPQRPVYQPAPQRPVYHPVVVNRPTYTSGGHYPSGGGGGGGCNTCGGGGGGGTAYAQASASASAYRK